MPGAHIDADERRSALGERERDMALFVEDAPVPPESGMGTARGEKDGRWLSKAGVGCCGLSE